MLAIFLFTHSFILLVIHLPTYACIHPNLLINLAQIHCISGLCLCWAYLSPTSSCDTEIQHRSTQIRESNTLLFTCEQCLSPKQVTAGDPVGMAYSLQPLSLSLPNGQMVLSVSKLAPTFTEPELEALSESRAHR